MNDELGDFVEMLTAWHSKKVSNLRDVQEASKEGTLLKLGDDDEGFPLTDREAKFFKIGCPGQVFSDIPIGE
ncbi:hypothetical protein J8G26_04080, partial [Acidovorax sp. JG5]|uniref:hypothetical protein n=1 Tax=Acidovorax sp. JG5 TaxID=2822718 RepID=UPI001B31C4BF